jgi:hypothetical protein
MYIRSDRAVTLTDSTFDRNEARGGSGNTGGAGYSDGGGAGVGGGIFNPNQGTLSASRLTLRENLAVGGAGNTIGLHPGAGVGGGLENESTAALRNSTITDNQAIGGQGGAGGNGSVAQGGGLANELGLLSRSRAAPRPTTRQAAEPGGIRGKETG